MARRRRDSLRGRPGQAEGRLFGLRLDSPAGRPARLTPASAGNRAPSPRSPRRRRRGFRPRATRRCPRPRSPRIESQACAESTEPADAHDMTEPAEPAEATEKAEPADPIDPIEANEPTDPIDRAEPFEAIERKESSDQSERELSRSALTVRGRRRPSAKTVPGAPQPVPHPLRELLHHAAGALPERPDEHRRPRARDRRPDCAHPRRLVNDLHRARIEVSPVGLVETIGKPPPDQGQVGALDAQHQLAGRRDVCDRVRERDLLRDRPPSLLGGHLFVGITTTASTPWGGSSRVAVTPSRPRRRRRSRRRARPPRCRGGPPAPRP